MCAYVHEFHGEAGMITAKPGFSKSIRERKKEREIEEKKTRKEIIGFRLVWYKVRQSNNLVIVRYTWLAN